MINENSWEGFFYCSNCEMAEMDTVSKLVCQDCGETHDFD